VASADLCHLWVGTKVGAGDVSFYSSSSPVLIPSVPCFLHFDATNYRCCISMVVYICMAAQAAAAVDVHSQIEALLKFVEFMMGLSCSREPFGIMFLFISESVFFCVSRCI